MGLSNESAMGTGNKKFVTVSRRDSKFVIRVPEGTEGAEARVIEKGAKEGQTVYEMKYSTLSGDISKIDYVKKQFGEFIEVTIDDCVLQISWNDFRVRDSFIKRIVNANFCSPVEFVLFPDSKTHEPVFLIKQAGASVPMSFTKANPEGIPQATQTTERGTVKWDFSAIENFLYEKLMEVITTNFGSNDAPPTA